MKLYLAPGSCALGILIMLEEIGQPFDLEIINFQKGEHKQPAFLAVNPKGKVPALLRDDGSVLTEYSAIAYWLARTFPAAKLFSDDLEKATRLIEAVSFISGDIHKAGMTNIIVPHKLTADPAAQDELRAAGRANAESGFVLMSEMLGDKKFLFNEMSIADPTAYYVCCWADMFKVEMPENVRAFYDAMSQRPAVQRAVAAWSPKPPA